MSQPIRFATTLTAIAMASVIAGCATPQAAQSGASVGKTNIGVATRALAALHSNDFANAVKYGEQAVENSPNDAGLRALLGNAYFASGRFASAEAAYRDSLSLNANQPQSILKLALVQIANGRNGEALAFLNQARNHLEAADYGLAIALAGQPQDAINVLEPAAREVGADARVRQNLALAYALSGDWDSARTIAAQDLPADLVDGRVQQWMTFAKPTHASDQVAALTGFKPAAADPGQPARLALRSDDNSRVAQAAPAISQPPVAAFVPQSPPEVAQVEPAPAPAPAPVVAESLAPVPQTPSSIIASVATMVADAPSAVAEMAGLTNPQPKKAKAAARRAPLHRAALRRGNGNSTSVLQLGAYGSPERVAVAWNDAAKRHSVLRGYSPMSARFNSPKGVVYRLSVRGFGSASEAKDLCLSLRKAGAGCFVRTVAGDQPVRLASR